MNLKKITIIICILWTIIVSFWVIKSEYILITGRKVLLKTIPVDPKDLFMGDYVILNYDISQLPPKYKYLSLNKDVYVVLDIDKENVATIERIVTKVPQNELYLKGKISKCDTIIPFWKNGACISYGIESYFVKENTGLELENDLRNGAFVQVSIDRHGNAKVQGFVNKKMD